jgi:signal transduction histidine kinase
MGMAAQLRAACADGRSIPVEISLSPVAMGSEVYVIAAVRDVADREMAHEELRAARARLAVADDRDRIARDLHDTVIQRVFASALTLQAISRSVEDPARSRVLGVVDDLDMTIRQLRAAVFDLKQPGHADDVIGLLAPVIDDAARVLGFAPRVVVEGVSSFVPAIVAGELSAVLREALSNIMRHASASEVDIELVLSSALVRLTVSDDGVGISARSRGGSGLANMQARAAALAGSFAATRRPDRGSRVVWEVPITAAMVASSSVP